MTGFAQASVFHRRQMLEEALGRVLRRIGDITHNIDGERCLAVTTRRCEGEVEVTLYSLYDLARELEVELS